jgi:hypothetical protein
MGFLKKITRPISKVLDKIVPNEIKPALPFLAAAAPFLAPGIMGTSMLQRALVSGGLNLGSQLAQEGSDGDFSALSLAMASGIGALSAPGSGANAANPVNEFGTKGVVGQPSAADYFSGKAAGMDPGFAKSGLGALEKSSNYLTGVGETLRTNPFSMDGLKASLVPVGQATTDLAIAENRRLLKEQEQADADAAAEQGADNASRAFAIRQSMEAYGFTEQEILDAIEAAGYRAGGRVGYAFGDFVKGSGVAQPVSASMRSGDRPMMSGSGMGGMLSNMINNNPQLFSNLTGQRNNSVSNMSRDFIDLNENGIDDRQEKAIGGRVGLMMGGSSDPDFSGIKGAVKSVDENMRADRAGDFFRLREEAIQKGDSDKIKEIESDFFREFGMVMPKMAKDGGLMNLGGKEMDLRKGGFVPIGKKERADDVPARLSKNEFVMTADAVRAAGGGSVNEGAKRMYDVMNKLEARA